MSPYLMQVNYNILIQRQQDPRGDAGGLSREYVLRVPSVS